MILLRRLRDTLMQVEVALLMLVLAAMLLLSATQVVLASVPRRSGLD